jgi:RHS repeat-associated protein
LIQPANRKVDYQDHGNGVRTDFVYDALGNRKESNLVAGRGAVTFYRRDNGLNQYSSWTPSIIYYDDNYPGWAGGWPGNGVMMAEGYITASYNALNQPVAVWSPAYIGTSNYMWFGFDPLGRCVKRWVGPSSTATTATYFYYDGWNLIQEGTGAAAAERIYLHGNRVDGIVCHYNYAHARWRYHHYDARGHCILVTDPNGALIEQYEYDAFGRPYFYNASNGWLSDTGDSAFGNRFLFTGREWLSDLKLYDYRHRLYQPELGRFLQPDPIHFEAGDYNLYRYCHNDPVNNSDPTGLVGLTSTGDGDWDWFNGDVALAQLSQQTAPTVHHNPLAAARSQQSAVGAAVKTDKSTEIVSALGRAEDDSKNYVMSPLYRGNGVGEVTNSEFSGIAQNSDITAKHLPVGFRKVVGFVLGHPYWDRRFVARDINIAIKNDYEVAIIVGEMRGKGNQVVTYVRGKPLPKY